MIVNVKQTNGTLFWKKYFVAIDGKNKCEIKRRIFSLKSVFEIRDYETSKEIGFFKNKLISLLADSEIEIGSEKYSFRQEPLKTMKFNCQNQNDEDENYLIQSHVDNSTSIFRNNTQIASKEV